MNRRAAERRWRRWLRSVGWRSTDRWPSRQLEAELLATAEILAVVRRRAIARGDDGRVAVWEYCWRRAARRRGRDAA